MFTLDDEQVTVKIRGKEYTLRAPSAREHQEWSKKFSQADGDPVDLFEGFFESVGLKKEVSSTLTLSQLGALFQHVTGLKKS